MNEGVDERPHKRVNLVGSNKVLPIHSAQEHFAFCHARMHAVPNGLTTSGRHAHKSTMTLEHNVCICGDSWDRGPNPCIRLADGSCLSWVLENQWH